MRHLFCAALLVGTFGAAGCHIAEADSDQDGIVDSQDHCPTQAGPASNGGCPLSSGDSDMDGVPDNVDRCPTQSGPASNNGCPLVTQNCTYPSLNPVTSTVPTVSVQANSSPSIQSTDRLFFVTVNASGGFAVAWTDQQNTGACFNGYIRTATTFDSAQTTTSGGATAQFVSGSTNTLEFYSIPGAGTARVDTVTTAGAGSETIYVDGYINGSFAGTQIVYIDRGGAEQNIASPAAFVGY